MNEFTEQWWKVDGDKADTIFATVKAIVNDNSDVLTKQILYARMYSNSEITGLSPHDYKSKHVGLYEDFGRIKLNVVASVCDTVNAKMSKNKPRVTLLPNGADFAVQHRTKNLEKFIAGVFDQSDLYQEGSKVFMDSLIFGTGVLRIFNDNGNIAAERVMPNSIVVDTVEGFYGSPKSMHQRTEVARDELISMFPEHKATIIEAGPVQFDGHTSYSSVESDTVTVVESWHLGSGDSSGRHVISVDAGDLLDEEYKDDDFPFVFLRWTKPIAGFFGIGIVSNIVGLQTEINRLLIKIQATFHKLANPTVFVDSASKVVSSHLNNEIGAIVKYIGQPPIVSTPQTVHSEVFSHLWQLYGKAFEISGVSQLSATSRKPEGLDSGTALREYNNIESERFALAGQNYEAMYVDAGKKIIKLAQEIYANDKGYSIKTKGRTFIETIKWKDVKVDDGDFDITVAPKSGLPETKAGRTQIVTDWAGMNLIEPAEWRELLDLPDLQDTTELARAPHDYIKLSISKMLAEGVYLPPEPMDDLAYAFKYAVMVYQRAKVDLVADESLELLLNYISDVESLQEESKRQMEAEAMEAQQKQQLMQQAAAPVPAPMAPKMPTKPIA